MTAAAQADALDSVQLSFPTEPPERARAARKQAESKHAREIALMVPIAQDVLQRAGAAGVTIDNVRLAGQKAQLLTGHEQGRALSWLSGVMKAAGAKQTGLFRRSRMPRSHRIPKVVWIAPEYWDERLHGEQPAPVLEVA